MVGTLHSHPLPQVQPVEAYRHSACDRIPVGYLVLEYGVPHSAEYEGLQVYELEWDGFDFIVQGITPIDVVWFCIEDNDTTGNQWRGFRHYVKTP